MSYRMELIDCYGHRTVDVLTVAPNGIATVRLVGHTRRGDPESGESPRKRYPIVLHCGARNLELRDDLPGTYHDPAAGCHDDCDTDHMGEVNDR